MTIDSATPIKDTKGRPPWLVRTVIVAVGLGLWFFTQSLIGSRPLDPQDNFAGIPLSRGDSLFNLTEPINEYLHVHPNLADLLLIASSAVIDILGIWLIATSIFGASMRPFVGLIVLFALRQLTQAMCVLPTPEGMIWRDPGVPSLLVTYHVANDFFFSGHTAIAVLAATQLARRQRPGLFALGVVLAVFEIATVIVLRAHYTMDVIAGTIAALWAAHAADYLSPRIDRVLAGCGSNRWNGTGGNGD
jgi:membrane-associated phospholipid phosphatase